MSAARGRHDNGPADAPVLRGRIDVGDLLAFVAIAQLGSVSKAAKQLNVAQSALSRRLLRLEGRLRLRLLERHARGTRLTEVGRFLLGRGEALNEELLKIESELRSYFKPEKIVNLAIPHGAFQLFGSELIARFNRIHPEAKLRLFVNESILNRGQVIDGQVDLALAYNPEPAAELTAVPLLVERLLVIGAKSRDGDAIRHPDSYPVSDLGRLPLVMPGPRHGYRRVVEHITRAEHAELNVALEVNGLSAISALIENGSCYTVSTYAHMRSLLEDDRAAAIPIRSPRCEVTLYMLELTHSPPSKARAMLVRAITETIAKLDDTQFYRVLLRAMPE